MSERKRVIDFQDLEIPITESLEPEISAATGRLLSLHQHIEVKPKLSKGTLAINSMDAINLLGYIEISKLSELDLARIKKVFVFAIEQALLRSTSLDGQAHYKWCLTAVKSFELGRFLQD